MTLPRFAVLKSNFNDKCLHYIHEDGEVHGFLQFSGEQVSSQYSKYELEMANISSNGNVLVHIKCCYNNKYFVRWSPNHWWILATADEPEEDQSKWSCTLFEPRRVSDCDAAQTTIGSVTQTIRLRHMRPKSNAFTRETIALPRFVANKSNYNGKYLRYIHEDGLEHESVQFFGEEFVSPYTKYEVVMARTNGGRGPFVHLRCCYSNKYLVKWSSMHRWIVAGNSMLDPDRRDLYTIIDWESLFILPKCVAFRGNNGKYLSPCSIKGHQYLHFSSSSEITDPMVYNEVITTPNGSVCIKSHHLGEFWGRNNQNWILADSDDSTSSNNNNNSSSFSSIFTRIFIGRSEKGRNQKQK
ncbi:hypothetical protein ACSBR1_006800 [Camellia fascicularis]